MGRYDWYRNRDWSVEIEAQFLAQLKRARKKAQYLRIQAGILARSHPQTALRLLDQYFSTSDEFDRSQAYYDQGTAFYALGDMEQAVAAFERAVDREIEYPGVYSEACIELPFLLATTGQTEKYPRALEILSHRQNRLLFSTHAFKWHAASSLISASIGEIDAARLHAKAALEFASLEHSGLPYHPSLGLVGPRFEELRQHLAGLARGGGPGRDGRC